MPTTVPVQTRTGQFSLIQAELPEHGLVTLGVLLQDPERDELHLRLRRDLETLADEEDLDVLSALGDDLSRKAREMGAESLLRYCEDTLSGAIRVTNREPVLLEDFERAVDRLYRQHVQSKVLEFRTHLPRYSLKVAAGKFLENEEISDQGWVETPAGLRLTPDMFVAQIEGHSMEPLIPNGSLCVFRAGVTGSRNNRLVLVESLETTGSNRYTVKRYSSVKSGSEEGWKHQRIHLESLNPDYPSWDLEPDEEKYRIIAEFVAVLG
jgi:hypothetical protein